MHVKEHFRVYFCIPPESIRNLESPTRYIFRGISEPDSGHSHSNKEARCDGRRFGRVASLADHLIKIHGLQRDSISTQQYEYAIYCQYLACGFCIFGCDSLTQLLNHIIDSHYRFSAHIRDWDPNKVVRGLLHQPSLEKYWQAVLAENPQLQEESLRWDTTVIERLQPRLEMDREPADVLCRAALNESTYAWQKYIDDQLKIDITGLKAK